MRWQQKARLIIVAEKLSPQQMVEAQELAAKIQYKIDNPTNNQISISKTKKQINSCWRRSEKPAS
jgi:hypothetical protein